MADSAAKDRKKLEGHRRSIREHIAKHERYPDANDKAFALKTVRRVQAQAQAILRKHPSLASSWEDSWRP